MIYAGFHIDIIIINSQNIVNSRLYKFNIANIQKMNMLY